MTLTTFLERQLDGCPTKARPVPDITGAQTSNSAILSYTAFIHSECLEAWVEWDHKPFIEDQLAMSAMSMAREVMANRQAETCHFTACADDLWACWALGNAKMEPTTQLQQEHWILRKEISHSPRTSQEST